ncbi:methylated-DNA--[protein]-cysteine S-methyltransferase [Nitratireductor sp. GISD-1A_MAKvit]|uniref:methylated-DNA--[protein]-cysteine S-methyltransferase n=1 Tax=Nitratireductor sp. GISD-1A_MAKvit TaxID=3234198 RepID=UPI0034651B8E
MHPTGRHIFETAFGFCGVVWGENGLSRLVLPSKSAQHVEEQLATNLHGPVLSPPHQVVALIASIQRYFHGELEDFSNVPLDFTGTPPFHRTLYTAMRRLGYGETTTYGDLCKSVGFPTAARETGAAMGRNPVPLIIPCHRVLAAGGRIGGFSADGGVRMKRRMLALERARPPLTDPAQASFPF